VVFRAENTEIWHNFGFLWGSIPLAMPMAGSLISVLAQFTSHFTSHWLGLLSVTPLSLHSQSKALESILSFADTTKFAM